jgi:hypothetical protein
VWSPVPLLAELIRGGAKVWPVRHPVDNAAAESGYRPSTALERFVRCRDVMCRFPHCDRSDQAAELYDIDHTVPHPLGMTHPSTGEMSRIYYRGQSENRRSAGRAFGSSPVIGHFRCRDASSASR